MVAEAKITLNSANEKSAEKDNWETVLDKASGTPYYLNKATSQTLWTKPACLEAGTVANDSPNPNPNPNPNSNPFDSADDSSDSNSNSNSNSNYNPFDDAAMAAAETATPPPVPIVTPQHRRTHLHHR